MNITFDTLKIQNFQSIGNAILSLSKRGVVTVTGVNNYDDNTLSNGSGKSSIFASLFWALYGKTPEGITDPTNKYSGGICQVIIEFKVDNNAYIVTREVRNGSQSVNLEINGQNQSGRNKSDSDKIIRNDILHMSADIFLSLVYLSQGFATRLSSLTPSARKERLEQLTNTAEVIDNFSKVIADKKSLLNDTNRIYRDGVSKNEGSIETLQSTIAGLNAKLELADAPVFYVAPDGTRYTSIDIPQLQAEIDKVYQEEQQVQTEFNNAARQRDSFVNAERNADLGINDYLSRKTNTLDAIDNINNRGTCPTCHQKLEVTNKDELLNSYVSQIKEFDEKLSELESEWNEAIQNKERVEQLVLSASNSLEQLRNKRSCIQRIISQIPNNPSIDVNSIKSDIDKYTSECENIQRTKELSMEKLSKSEISLDVITHCQQMLTKAFRAYLLTGIINYMNVRLKEYSSALFSNESDRISILADSQKLDIVLGNADYITLSGGERRKVDLATMLAQRDLAAELAGVTCNLLVLDEIMESMDETATQVTLDLLESRSDTVDSMFIISHNNYALPVDSRITVTKGPNRVSVVSDM